MILFKIFPSYYIYKYIYQLAINKIFYNILFKYKYIYIKRNM